MASRYRRRRKGHDESWLLSYADLITNLLIFFVAMLSASQISTAKFEELAENLSGKEARQSLRQIQKSLEEEISKSDLKDVVTTTLDADGLQISMNAGVMFATASAKIEPAWEPMVEKVIATVVPYAGKYKFAVEGHTDWQPITSARSEYQSNWMLGSGRAAEIRNKLEAAGVRREATRIESYADTEKLSEQDLSGLEEAERLARHRRVVIRIY